MKTSIVSDSRSVPRMLAAASADPLILRSRLFCEDAPSKKITVGCIGDAEASKLMQPQMRAPWAI